jgi:hypothetical protein
LLSLGLLVNLLFLAFAGYIFHKSLGFLRELLRSDSLKPGILGLIRKAGQAVGLLIWFGVGTLAMTTGLTGLFNRMLLALQ